MNDRLLESYKTIFKNKLIRLIEDEIKNKDNSEQNNEEKGNENESKINALVNILSSDPTVQKAEEKLFESVNVLSEGAFTDKLKKIAAFIAISACPLLMSSNAQAVEMTKVIDGNAIAKAYAVNPSDAFDQITNFEKALNQGTSGYKTSIRGDASFGRNAVLNVVADSNNATVNITCTWIVKQGQNSSKVSFEGNQNFKTHFKNGGDMVIEYNREFDINSDKDISSITKLMKFGKNSMSNDKETVKMAKDFKKTFKYK